MYKPYNEYIQERVYEEARRIIDSLKGGKLYGKEIDPFNTAEMIVAAYYAGLLKTSLYARENPFEEKK